MWYDLMRYNERCDTTDYFTALCCIQYMIYDEIVYGTLHYLLGVMYDAIPYVYRFTQYMRQSSNCPHYAIMERYPALRASSK